MESNLRYHHVIADSTSCNNQIIVLLRPLQASLIKNGGQYRNRTCTSPCCPKGAD